MLRFILKRVLISAAILFIAMFAVYLIMYNLPASYTEKTARELAVRPGNTKSAEQWISELNAEYGLDKNPAAGYFTWLGNALQGNFGDSWCWSVPVTEKFRDVIWNSFFLALTAFALEVFIAVPLGIYAARRQYGPADYTVTSISLIGISLPSFFVAAVLKMVFAVKLKWLPVLGMETARLQGQSTPFYGFLDTAKHFVLPAATLVAVNIGSLMRYTRANMLEVLGSDYIRTARAKGLPESKVIYKHAFRNTLIPLVTVLGGSLPGLFSGALITETLFSIRGIGYISYDSMIQGDIPFTMFYLAFSAVLILFGNLVSDILYAAVDPRVRVH